MALMVWKCAPAYLSDLCVPATAILDCHHLRPAATGTLLVPRAQTATGQRSFAVNGPSTWNHLPLAVLSPDLSPNLLPDINILTDLLTLYAYTSYEVFIGYIPSCILVYFSMTSINMLILRPFLQDNLGKLTPEQSTILYFHVALGRFCSPASHANPVLGSTSLNFLRFLSYCAKFV